MTNPEDIVVKPGGYITAGEAGRLTAIKRKKAKEKQIAGRERVAGLAAQKEKDKAAFAKGLGVSGESTQRQQGAQEDYSPYINTGLKKPEDYRGGGSADYAPSALDKYTGAALGELEEIREMPGSGKPYYGAGTKEDPFTGTAARTSGFVEATPEDIAMREANTEGGKYLGGYKGGVGAANRATAAYDLYRDDQMRQVAANERGSTAHLADIEQQKAIRKQDNLQKALFRKGGRYKGLSQRRQAEVLGGSIEEQSEIRDQGTRRAIASEVRDVGLADASSAKFTGQGQMAKARADIEVQGSRENIELMKIMQQDREFKLGRQTSARDAQQAMSNIVGKMGDMMSMNLKDPETMSAIREEAAMIGMDPRSLLSMMQQQQTGRTLGS